MQKTRFFQTTLAPEHASSLTLKKKITDFSKETGRKKV
jgi:hypothetical protein